MLDPRYLTGDRPITVAEPPADGEAFDQGTFGDSCCSSCSPTAVSLRRPPATLLIGWGGDQYVAWRDGQSPPEGDLRG